MKATFVNVVIYPVIKNAEPMGQVFIHGITRFVSISNTSTVIETKNLRVKIVNHGTVVYVNVWPISKEKEPNYFDLPCETFEFQKEEHVSYSVSFNLNGGKHSHTIER